MKDQNENGITVESLRKVLSQLGENVTEREIMDMIEEADRDEDGKVGWDDFFRLMFKAKSL